MASQSSYRDTVFLGSKSFMLASDSSSTHSPGAPQPEERLLKSGAQKTDASLRGASSSSSRESASRVESLVPVTAGDPSMIYEKKYQVLLDKDVGVYKRKQATEESFDIRTISGPDSEEKLHILSHNHHENLLHVYEIFAFGDVFYTVSEHMALSCGHLISCGRPLEEVHVATICCQFLRGLSFLASQGMAHGAITCSNILLNKNGDVKIANQESCTYISHSEDKDTKIAKDREDAGRMMITLTDGVEPEDGSFILQFPDRWSEAAIHFLASIISESYEATLANTFLKGAPIKTQLDWFIEHALMKSYFKIQK